MVRHYRTTSSTRSLNRSGRGLKEPLLSLKENRYRMEMSNCYKGVDDVTIHAIEHDIVLTQDIIFGYIKTGQVSPVLNLNY